MAGILLCAGAEAVAPPSVDSFTAVPAAVVPGDTVLLEVQAHDPDCPSICTTGCGLYIRSDLTSWQATDGAFEFIDVGTSGSPYVTTAVWRAPAAEGTYTITLSLSDSGGMLCGGRQTTTATLDVVVSAVVNLPPLVDVLTAQPPTVLSGQTSQLRCEASDPEGDAVTYGWSTTSGTVTPSGIGLATFTASDPGVATITCTATDPGGAAGSRLLPLSVTDAVPLASLRAELATPQRVAVDSMGDAFVVDPGAGGLVVLNLGSGSPVYRVPWPQATSVAVDWGDRLLVGQTTGAVVADRLGNLLLALDPDEALGEVADVAVDLVNRRYGVLHASAARVVVFDQTGAIVGSFGATGDGPAQMRNPRGLAATPAGDWVVADSVHGLIKVFDLGGALLRSFGGLGGDAGEFVQLDDVAVNADGVVLASDAFQSRVQSFNPDGSLREVLGTYGDAPGGLKTPTGIAAVDGFGRLVVASLNTPSLEVFSLSSLAPVLPSPVATSSPESLVFGSQVVGTTSAPRTVTLANQGDAPMGVGAIWASAEFSEASGCPAVLDPGSACTIEVRFTPTAPGVRSGVLGIETSTATGVLTVDLVGEGFVPPGLALSPVELGFPDQDVFTVSDPLPVVVTNTGTLPLSFAGILASGEYQLAGDCGGGLGPGASCTLLVSFAPLTIADHIPGSVQIVSTAAGSPHVVALDGRGTGLEILAEPGRLDFGTVTVGDASAARTVTVRNAGSDFVTVASVGVEGPASAEFRVVEDGCSAATLFREQECFVSVVYEPVAGGQSEAWLRVASDALGSPDTVELVGVGEQQAAEAIPTLSGWGMVALVLALAGIGLVMIRRRCLP